MQRGAAAGLKLRLTAITARFGRKDGEQAKYQANTAGGAEPQLSV
jgi:hypothetical protein